MMKSGKLLFQKQTSDGLIEVWDEGLSRCLGIDAIEQTCINIEQPALLASPVHRYFLAALLFIETPKKVLLGGLGGGALARYLYNREPDITGHAVEINETIAMLAKKYFYFPQQWKIMVDDFQHWHGRHYDLMVVDIAEVDLTPLWLTSEKVLLQLKEQLSEHGVLAIDLLVDDARSFTLALSKIRKIFKRQTLCLSIPEHKNIIVFAFNTPPINASIQDAFMQDTSMQALPSRVEKLTKLWGLEFSTFIEQLKKDNPEDNGIF